MFTFIIFLIILFVALAIAASIKVLRIANRAHHDIERYLNS